MLWTSLRFGWGNTGPVILLALLPLLTAAPAMLGRQPAIATSARLHPGEAGAAGDLLVHQDVVALDSRAQRPAAQ